MSVDDVVNLLRLAVDVSGLVLAVVVPTAQIRKDKKKRGESSEPEEPEQG